MNSGRYYQKFEVRWSDIDANRHLANSSYIEYASHTRIAFLAEKGFGQDQFATHNIGPAALYEQLNYFKEVHFQDIIYVALMLAAVSRDGKYFMFHQPIYRDDGKNIALCIVKGVWIDLTLRKPTSPPDELYRCIEQMPKTDHFKYIEKEDFRDPNVRPQSIDPSSFLDSR